MSYIKSRRGRGAALLAALLAVGLAGCGGGSDGGGPQPPPNQMKGTYTGTFESQPPGADQVKGLITLNIKTDNSIAGQLSSDNARATFPGTGSVSSTGVMTVRFTVGTAFYTFRGTILFVGATPEVNNGTWTSTSGPSGDWTAQRQSTEPSPTATPTTGSNTFYPGSYRLDYSITSVTPPLTGNFTLNVDATGNIVTTTITFPFIGAHTISGNVTETGVVTLHVSDPDGDADRASITLRNNNGTISGSGQFLDSDPAPGQPSVLGTFTITKIS